MVLWIVFVALSVVAFFAILFTTRYPRSIFEFNVGVLRWTWRTPTPPFRLDLGGSEPAAVPHDS